MTFTQITYEDIRSGTITSHQIASGAVEPANTNLSASWNFASGSLFYKTPTVSDEVAIKSYVDTVVQGVRDPKDAVRAAASASIALTGTFTLDDIALSAGDRVLAFGQSTASTNGIYEVSTGSWFRAADADGTPAGEVTQGLYTLVAAGTIFEGVGFLLTTEDPITVDVTDLNFVQFTGLGKVVAGNGLTKDGNRLDVGAGPGIVVTDDAVQVDHTIVADKTGSNTWTGDNTFSAGLTGSLQQVTSGQSYLVQGDNINIVSGTNGSVTISANVPAVDAPDISASYVVVGLTSSLPNERFLSSSNGLLITDNGANASLDVSINTASVVTLDRFVFNERSTGSFPGMTFETKFSFASGTLRVYRRGMRMAEGAGFDYVVDTEQQVTFTKNIIAQDLLTFDYIKAN